MQSCAQVHELPQSYCCDKQEGTLFSWLHVLSVLGSNMNFLTDDSNNSDFLLALQVKIEYEFLVSSVYLLSGKVW